MRIKLRTNVNNISDVQQVSPFLEDETRIVYWHINTEEPNKTLFVDADGLSKDDIIRIVRKAGYTAWLLKPDAMHLDHKNSLQL